MTQLEGLRTQMDEMGSTINDQFIMHILGDLTSDYENQVDRLQERIGHIKNVLIMDDRRESLPLLYERRRDGE
jgi:hypothetical protein